jgi:hypothetical protein
MREGREIRGREEEAGDHVPYLLLPILGRSVSLVT